MRVYKNLTIIGTSHISKESILKVGNFISKNKPDLKDIGEIGIKGFLINLIGAYIEKKLGKLVGVMPGSEMKTAFELSREYNTKIALIDQDISITLKKLGRRITFKEKFRIVKDLLKGIIFRKSDIEPFDLTKVPSESLILK